GLYVSRRLNAGIRHRSECHDIQLAEFGGAESAAGGGFERADVAALAPAGRVVDLVFVARFPGYAAAGEVGQRVERDHDGAGESGRGHKAGARMEHDGFGGLLPDDGTAA